MNTPPDSPDTVNEYEVNMNELFTVERGTYKWEVSGSTPCGVVLVEGFVHRSARPRRCYQRIPPRAADGTTFPATNYGSEIRVVVSP